MSDTCFFHFLQFSSETYCDCGCLRYKDSVICHEVAIPFIL